VNREYDLFEALEDGSLLWRDTGSGHGESLRKLQELAANTKDEVRMM
jgi:hypothetical protein